MEDPIVAGAHDAAKELGYDITSSTVQHQQDEYTGYSFAFDAPGGEGQGRVVGVWGTCASVGADAEGLRKTRDSRRPA